MILDKWNKYANCILESAPGMSFFFSPRKYYTGLLVKEALVKALKYFFFSIIICKVVALRRAVTGLKIKNFPSLENYIKVFIIHLI